ncbi:hypothetical protein [Pontiella sp.]|uniref:hypothetical protein n=1 Tax=Pontiella sp. TaxID=2837462 RepID=UPI003566F5E2
MKFKTPMMMILAAVSVAFAQSETEDTSSSSGVPASLLASNGKSIARVYLQSLADGNLTFAVGGRAMTVPLDKVTSVGFSMTKEEFDSFREKQTISDAEIAEISARTDVDKVAKLQLIFEKALGNIEAMYVEGDYAAAVAALESLMMERGQFMSIDNNLQRMALMLMDCYLKLGDIAGVGKYAAVLRESSNPKAKTKALVGTALMAVERGDFEAADKVAEELESEAAKLYLKASIERAQKHPTLASKTVCEIIAAHGNDLEWMPQSELLSAHLYLDVGLTNSAVNTARQVKNIYAGTNIAGDAAKLFYQLGGEEKPAEATSEEMPAEPTE